MNRIMLETPCILLEQVEQQKYFSPEEPVPMNSSSGYHIWYVEEDGDMCFLGFATNESEAIQRYIKGSLPIYYTALASKPS